MKKVAGSGKLNQKIIFQQKGKGLNILQDYKVVAEEFDQGFGATDDNTWYDLFSTWANVQAEKSGGSGIAYSQHKREKEYTITIRYREDIVTLNQYPAVISDFLRLKYKDKYLYISDITVRDEEKKYFDLICSEKMNTR